MSCSPHDLRDYHFGELSADARQEVERHARACQDCREELERLRLTESALLSLRDEEVPQRIGFVSDRVYEPSAARRWWQSFWNSGPKLGFASAAMLSVAIVVASFRPQPPAANPAVDVAAIRAEVANELRVALREAMVQSEAKQATQTVQLLQAAEGRIEEKRRLDQEQISKAFAFWDKYIQWYQRASLEEGGPR